MAALLFILRNIEEIIAGTMMVLMFLATIVNVVARYAFNSPIPWTEEISRYTFIWMVFIGAAVCTKRGKHICIDSLILLMPRRTRSFLILLSDVAVVALMLIMIYYGSILAMSSNYPTSTLRMPTYLVYMALPLSALLVLLHSAKDMFLNLRAAFGGGIHR